MKKTSRAFFGIVAALSLTFGGAAPAHASITIVSAPVFNSIDNGIVDVSIGTYSGVPQGDLVRGSIYACGTPRQYSGFPASLQFESSVPAGCDRLSQNSNGVQGVPGPLASAFILLNGVIPGVSYSAYGEGKRHLIYVVQIGASNFLWTTSREYVAPSSTPGSEDEVPPPVYFGGPLVMGSTLHHFTQGEEGTVTLTGKRMNKITSATINGVAVTVTADRRSATITVPATLAAGTYDLVLQTTNGRLTVMRFIKVS